MIEMRHIVRHEDWQAARRRYEEDSMVALCGHKMLWIDEAGYPRRVEGTPWVVIKHRFDESEELCPICRLLMFAEDAHEAHSQG